MDREILGRDLRSNREVYRGRRFGNEPTAEIIRIDRTPRKGMKAWDKQPF